MPQVRERKISAVVCAGMIELSRKFKSKGEDTTLGRKADRQLQEILQCFLAFPHGQSLRMDEPS